MKGERIVSAFVMVSLGAAVLALTAVGIIFGILFLMHMRRPESQDMEYKVYMKKGFMLRFCYGCSVGADILLKVLEIAAAGVGAYIALIPDASSTLVAEMLIIAFISAAIQSALDLKHCRKAYARAFRILEFAVDDYRTSEKDAAAKAALHEANRQAQQVIENLFESCGKAGPAKGRSRPGRRKNPSRIFSAPFPCPGKRGSGRV